ncbi:hypothetical protein Tco_0606844 [Tanacetum coccineum]
MSNTNNTMQTQTSSALHNAIMEAGRKDRPPMLAPGNYMLATPVIPDSEGTSQPPRGEVMETFASVSKDTQNWIIAEPEVVQIILTGIDNDIYSTVDACPNAMEMWKARLLQHL